MEAESWCWARVLGLLVLGSLVDGGSRPYHVLGLGLGLRGWGWVSEFQVRRVARCFFADNLLVRIHYIIKSCWEDGEDLGPFGRKVDPSVVLHHVLHLPRFGGALRFCVRVGVLRGGAERSGRGAFAPVMFGVWYPCRSWNLV